MNIDIEDFSKIDISSSYSHSKSFLATAIRRQLIYLTNKTLDTYTSKDAACLLALKALKYKCVNGN